MKKKFNLAILVLIALGIQISSNAQVYNPGGSSGIGTSSTTGVGIGLSGPRASLDVHYNCVQGSMATLLVTGSNGFLTCSGIGNYYGETFRVRTETASGIYRDDFVIKASTGKIGIGTFNPKTKLHIQDGSLKLTGTDPTYGAPNIFWGGTTSSAPDGEWALEYNTNISGYAGLNFWRPFGSSGSGAANNVLFLGNNNAVGIGTPNTTKATFTVNGTALIGDPSAINTATPFAYGLYVQNGILAERVKVAVHTDPLNWSDFVFAPGYKLMPVDSVSNFIQQNGHLPNVPSANDVFTNGVDVAQMDAMLLRQIEELWLHMIELENTNQVLKQELEKQKQ
jgi:hypothetical protein